MTRPNDIELRTFLRQSGWTQVDGGDSPTGESWLLLDDEDAPAILVPRNRESSDYDYLLSAALRRLTWTLGESEDRLAERITESVSDTLEIRVIDPSTRGGRIPLERGTHLAQSLWAVVMNGARLQFAGGRVVHSGGLTAAAREVVSRLELAPPSPGSFRLEVVAPSEMQLALESASLPSNAAHETLASALRAVDAVRQTTETAVPDDADDLDDAVSRGVSTNLVRAMRRIDTQSTALKVEFRGRWSRPDRDAPEAVLLEPLHFSRMRRLETVLKQYDPREHYHLNGWIKRVEADALALDAPLAGAVVVEVQIDRRVREVRVELAGDALPQAGAGIGRQFLTATGTLERIGREWYLLGASDVHIAPAPGPLDWRNRT